MTAHASQRPRTRWDAAAVIRSMATRESGRRLAGVAFVAATVLGAWVGLDGPSTSPVTPPAVGGAPAVTP